jgi:decaprenyl-phosphate phosphoribosyltransferase
MTEHPIVSAGAPSSLIPGLVKAVRPKQWAKNALVFIAPGAAGVLARPRPFTQAVFAFCIFSMAAGGTYLLNDVMDVESDRRHPTKRFRPIAAGIVPVPLALVLAPVCIVVAVLLGLWRNWQFGLIVGLYVVLTTLYSLWLKHQPVLDLVGLSSGFILRLLGGAKATEVPISNWFIIISCFGALFIATAKRQAERRELGDESASLRVTLAVYTDAYLNFLKAVSAGVVLVAYVEFALERADQHPPAAVWVQLSIVPFIVAILRYALLVEQGQGSAPEELLLSDRQMQVIGLVWAVLMGLSVYAR